MTDQPEDHEAIAALDAYCELGRIKTWPKFQIANMRRALDAAVGVRREQPASPLADDARKITEALGRVRRTLLAAYDRVDEEVAILDAAILLAESLPGKIEALESERDNANKAIQRIGMTLGSTDEWSDQETMIFDVMAHAEAAESQLSERDTEIVRLARMANGGDDEKTV